MYMLPENGEWIGAPVLVLRTGEREQILDGKKRLAEHRRRGLSSHVPRLHVFTHYEAVRFLILHGHHERAAAHAKAQLPIVRNQTASELSALLSLPSHQRLIPFLRALKAPAERQKQPRRAVSVVKRLRKLYNASLEGEEISPQDLAEALGEFLHE